MAAVDSRVSWPVRPRRSAAERKAQKRRAEARVVQHLLRAFNDLSHRGCKPTRLGEALAHALFDGDTTVSAASTAASASVGAQRGGSEQFVPTASTHGGVQHGFAEKSFTSGSAPIDGGFVEAMRPTTAPSAACASVGAQRWGSELYHPTASTYGGLQHGVAKQSYASGSSSIGGGFVEAVRPSAVPSDATRVMLDSLGQAAAAPPCIFFAVGACKYGANCSFAHHTAQGLVRHAVGSPPHEAGMVMGEVYSLGGDCPVAPACEHVTEESVVGDHDGSAGPCSGTSAFGGGDGLGPCFASGEAAANASSSDTFNDTSIDTFNNTSIDPISLSSGQVVVRIRICDFHSNLLDEVVTSVPASGSVRHIASFVADYASEFLNLDMRPGAISLSVGAQALSVHDRIVSIGSNCIVEARLNH